MQGSYFAFWTGSNLIFFAKCLVMLIFQRKFIYLPYLPFGARKQTLDDVPSYWMKDIECQQVSIPSEKGITLYGILATTAWRIPTITTDYLHVLHHALDQFPHSRIIVFGHSLGAAAAICLLSKLYPSPPSPSSSSSPRSHSWKSWFGFPTTSKLTHDEKFNRIQGLVLENPFSSIPDMIHAFYPEKWLPHHYLGPLAADKWDCVGALRRRTPSVLAKLAPDALVLQSESDEVVPKYMGETIYGLMRGDEERKGRLVVVKFAHHSDGWTSPTWAEEIKRYLELLSVR
ncbi:hypothetical protein F5887DRAFT_976935 [Amanita rubescens]|nr:hypothetical protein F5887DRAFT_976935 [Amanita rubescens]